MAKILIIDDDPDIVESTKIVLESKGYQVITAKDGREGIDKAKQEKPGLVILDVMMPNIDGFQVARTLRQNESFRDIPILMLTAIKDKLGLDLKDKVGDDKWSPVNEYCEKPLNHQELLSKVEKYVT